VLVRHGRDRPAPAPDESGLALAVWSDGSILLPAAEADADASLLVGKVDPNDLAAALHSLREAGFFTAERASYAVPDAGSAAILARDGGQFAARIWHGSLNPGFGGNVGTDADYRSFVKMWKAAESALRSLTPLEVQPLSDYLKQHATDTFRGYRPADPWQTPWMHDRNWRQEAGN
jgi:hypothetical protein